MKIRPVVAELTYTDEQTNMTKTKGSFSAMNMPKNRLSD